MPDNATQILIVAGESSGDLHAAKLVQAMRAAAPDRKLKFFGAAGPRMRDAGVEPVVVSDELSIVGLVEIGLALPMFLRTFSKLRRSAIDRKASIAILVDFPEFNLKLAKALKKQDIKVVYYISPQLWAWRSYRLNAVKKYIDLMITILPFEADWYRKLGFDRLEYVGSPLATEVFSDASVEDFCDKYGLDATRPIIALLPGSRSKEITRILPVMLQSAGLISRSRPEIQFVIAAADEVSARRTKSMSGNDHKVIVGATYDTLAVARAAAVVSGTATLESAILATPMAIVYKTSAINYSLLRPLISVEHFGLVNLIAGERVAKEMIQSEFTAEGLAAELLRLLEPDVNQAMRKKLRETTDKLGHGGASKRAAEAIVKLLDVSNP